MRETLKMRSRSVAVATSVILLGAGCSVRVAQTSPSPTSTAGGAAMSSPAPQPPSDSGRDENIRIRSTPPVLPGNFSGPYPPGEALTEKPVKGGVDIAGRFVKQEHYDAFVKDGAVPFRRELTDEELLASLRPDLRERIRTRADLAAYARKKFAHFIPRLIWDYRAKPTGIPPSGVAEAYDQYFDADGKLKTTYFAWGYEPVLKSHRWAAAYWETGDAKWARAVRDTFTPLYHHCRPPLNKVKRCGDSGAPWKTLVIGAFTPNLIESYAFVHDSPELIDEDHMNFFKAMLERGRYLRYATVPFDTWPKYGAFGYGNWILYQLQGLLALAVNFPEFAESPDWLQHATLGIGRHGDWVVMPDSGFDEYSYAYACQVASQMAYCYGLFTENRLPLPPRFDGNVLRLHEMFLKIAVPGGSRVPFGDVDRKSGPPASICRWASLAFLDGRFKHFANEASGANLEAGAQILHPENPAEAAKRYRELTPVPPELQSHILPEPGWSVMRGGWDDVATTVAMTYRASDRVFHSGWEMLGFNLWTQGEPLLIKLLGFESYMTGFPDGFCRTPRQANHVLVKDAEMSRVAGSLRNWFSSDTLDYIHADHRGWNKGQILSQRRLLFLKPDWVVIIDDIEGQGKADLLWQAHTGEVSPRMAGSTATITGAKGRVTVVALDAPLTTAALPVRGVDKTTHLLTASKSGELPLRFVTLLHVGAVSDQTPITYAMREKDGVVNLDFATAANAAKHTVRFESEESQTGRFLLWSGPKRNGGQAHFVASDGNASTTRDQLLPSIGAAPFWNGRVLLFTPGLTTPASTIRMDESISPESVHAFTYHGRTELTPVGTAGRVMWRTTEKARHSVLYRATGTSRWFRQFQPDSHLTAWVLLPDLVPGAEYELKVVSELESGVVASSPVFRRTAPKDWQPY